MRARSAYVLDCPCGERIESHEAEVVCAKCGRILAVEGWGKPTTEER